VSRGYETGTLSDTRALAGASDLFQRVVETGDRRSEVRKRLQTEGRRWQRWRSPDHLLR
jgi:hypothetical protein